MDKPEPVEPGPAYTIQMGIDREPISIDGSPLNAVKTSPNDLYAVQIGSKSRADLSLYNKYAYGIFDDQESMIIDLPSGMFYKIEITLVPNGKSIIAKDQNGKYEAPFITTGLGGGTNLPDNQFHSSKTIHLQYVGSGYAIPAVQTGVPQGYDRPDISRFYGVVDNFSPTENAKLTFDLKWVVFGLTVIPDGMTEGSLTVEMEGAPTMTILAGDPAAITKKIFSFKNTDPKSDWGADDYSEDIPVTITWTKADNSREVLLDASKPVTFKRRYESRIRVNMGSTEPPVSNGNVTISKEDETLVPGDETIVNR